MNLWTGTTCSVEPASRSNVPPTLEPPMKVNSRVLVGALTLAAVVSLAPSAWSGKPERDKQDALEPKIKATKDGIKTDCGCDVAMTVHWDAYKAVNDMAQIDQFFDALAKTSKGYCVKPADKKAYCSALTAVDVTWGTTFAKMDGKTLKVQSAATYSATDYELKQILNKF
jgi:hypothetical protein